MRRAVAVVGFSALVLTLSVSFMLLPAAPTRAAGDKANATFLIPAGEGYGVAECLTGGDSSCGAMVAAAWCEAQGFGRVERYGIADAEDMTGAVAGPAVPAPRNADAISITCAN